MAAVLFPQTKGSLKNLSPTDRKKLQTKQTQPTGGVMQVEACRQSAGSKLSLQINKSRQHSTDHLLMI